VTRRLSGERTETSAVFNLATQFGGGKTHALALLYHLARSGPRSSPWPGVAEILKRSGMASVPEARVATFVGTEFDALTGRGGADGTPLRKTPWGEIAWQLGGPSAFAAVEEHERQYVEPKGDVIRQFIPSDKPCLILLDEVINYAFSYRGLGYGNKLYNFVQALSETVRGMDNVVLVASISASKLEYTAEDEADEQRFHKMLDRLGKAVMMSAETETSQIIRRRLFEWQGGLPEDGKKTLREYVDWVAEHRAQVPNWFPVDNAWESFEATYPFHPIAISVFERKWQALPRFQRTRGVLRLLALWVARAYAEGFRGAQKDGLIDLGTAPLDDPLFRAAVFEQLGEDRLEAAVTTDICGKSDSHATRLDQTAVEAIRKARLHRKVATAIFFESNGGMLHSYATLPETRLAVGAPDLDIANVDTVLEALAPPDGACYYLDTMGNRCWFSVKPNLNKLLADRRASIQPNKITDIVRAEVQKVFAEGKGADRIYFPEKSGQIPDRPSLSVVVLPPERNMGDPATLDFIAAATRESGLSARTFKSALVWAVAEGDATLADDARKLLAWQEITDEQDALHLDDTQQSQLKTNLQKAARDLRESVWRSYRALALLDKDNTIREVDLGLVHSSAANTLLEFILTRLRQDGDIEESISPNFLARHWPPAFVEWSTRSVRDAFFASPLFPRLLSAEAVKDTIARGVTNGLLGYVGKPPDGRYDPFLFNCPMSAGEVEISDEVFIITKETAQRYIDNQTPRLAKLAIAPADARLEPGGRLVFSVMAYDQQGKPMPGVSVAWSATGGQIDGTGTYNAGAEPGGFSVTAAADGISATVTVRIVANGEPPPSPEPTAEPPPQRPPSPPKRLRWTGVVPAQKWMNFYTKVLSRFAVGQGLTITVTAEVSDAGGISQQKIDETKVALRELGLQDEMARD